MKKLILAFAFLFLFSGLAWADDFCDGWYDGYIAGYCHNQFQCMEPMVPMCPMQNMGEESYQDGYNRGFLAGYHARL